VRAGRGAACHCQLVSSVLTAGLLLPNARLELISQFKPQELLPSSLLDKFSEPAVAGQ
jgi:hypothetical protein